MLANFAMFLLQLSTKTIHLSLPYSQIVSFGCNSHQGVPRQTSLFLLKRQRTVSKKMKRNKTTHRTKMPGRTLLSFAHPFCFGTLSFAEGKIEYPMDLIIKRSLFFFWKLLACLLPCRGRKPDRRRSWMQRRRCNADRGLRPPKPLAAIRL